MPEDQLPDAAGLKNDRGTIARLLGAQGPPDFRAGIFVQSHDCRVGAAGQANQLVAVKERVSRKAPQGSFDFVVRFEIARPKDAARSGIQAEEIAFGSEREDLALADQGSGARAGRVADGVGTIVGMPPQNSSVGRVEADNRLGAGNAPAREGVSRFGRRIGKLVVEHVNAPLGHGGTGIAGANLGAPDHRRPAGRKRTDNAGLAPNAVPFGPKPLRPIVGPEAGRAAHRHCCQP